MLDPTTVAAFHAERAANRRLGIAVSGGSDSMALLLLLHRALGPEAVAVATVDHGLRAASAQEAQAVAAHCVALGIPHDILTWAGGPSRGNLQDQARRARYRLLAEWAAGRGIRVVAVGHTADDNAETLLMGLARGAGLDGLSGMRRAFDRGAVTFHRPLLGCTRAALRAELQAAGLGWADDPSNEDPRFDRIRSRQILAGLAPLGIDAQSLGRVIGNLRDSRTALDQTLASWAETYVAQDRGDLLIRAEPFTALHPDLARRLLNAALRWISGQDYPPRAPSVMQIVATGCREGDRSLHGCLLRRTREYLRLTREAAATRPPVPSDATWDGRWQLTGPHAPGLLIAALGESGLGQCPDWRETGLPRQSLISSPALWKDDTLVSAPLAGLARGWTANLAEKRDVFHSTLLSH